jgi:hypothetical protein
MIHQSRLSSGRDNHKLPPSLRQPPDIKQNDDGREKRRARKGRHFKTRHIKATDTAQQGQLTLAENALKALDNGNVTNKNHLKQKNLDGTLVIALPNKRAPPTTSAPTTQKARPLLSTLIGYVEAHHTKNIGQYFHAT